jgi:hypothetical protein
MALRLSFVSAHLKSQTLHIPIDNGCHILTLPTEIMADIFVDFLPDYPERPPITGLLSPALLGQICRNWREIAFDTPRLWRAIDLYLFDEGSTALDAQLDVLTTWLSRSKDCSLSLSFEIEEDFTSPKLPHFKAALLSRSADWEHIRLIIPFDDLLWIDGLFPLLHDLTLAPNDYSVAEDATTLFQDAPALKSVVIGRLFNPSQVVLPWSQLTSIAAELLFTHAAADVLRQAPALVNFICAVWGNDTPLTAVPPLIHLESLILRDKNRRPYGYTLLFDALTAPALRHLTISERPLDDNPISTIAAFLSRSCCSLQSLHVEKAQLPLAAYCAAFPSIPIIYVNAE